jgi:hypothetical protein
MILLASVLPACSTKTNPPGASGIVSGTKDSHCAETVTVDQAACHPASTGSGGDAGAGTADGGALAEGGAGTPDSGAEESFATLYNNEGDDDDCKYHVKWSAPNGVAQGAGVTFNIVLTTRAGEPVTGAGIAGQPVRGEVFLNDTHPAPRASEETSSNNGGGNYTLGPIYFDAPGTWTVRFHFFEDCDDSEKSPHGHAAFYVQVP